MQYFKLAAISALTLSALASPVPEAAHEAEATTLLARDAGCVPAVVFAVRGSDDNQTTLGYNPQYNQLPPGMTAVANAVIAKAGGDLSTGLRPLNYSAISAQPPYVQNGMYQQSVNQGIGLLQQVIENYVNACATGKIFVIGYSQGAQVSSSALGGSPSYAPLKVHGRVTGAAIIADPTYIDYLSPIDQGSGANNGINGRAAGDGDKQRYLNSNFAGRLQTYCQAEDEFCDSGNDPDSLSIHLNAPEYFQQNATTFLTSF